MKLFERTGGYWIFYISAAYFVVGMWSIYNGVDLTWFPPLYIFFLSMPFWFPPLGRSMNLDVTWDIKMFEWFKKKYTKEGDCDCGSCPTDNVVPFPELKAVPPMPAVKPPKEDPPAEHYRVGFNTKGMTTLTLLMNDSYGSVTLSMNQTACEQLIKMLRATYQEEVEDDNDLS